MPYQSMCNSDNPCCIQSHKHKNVMHGNNIQDIVRSQII